MSTLDNRSAIKEFDHHNYLSHILEAPQQLEDGFALGLAITIPAVLAQAKQVVIVASGEMLPVARAIQALSMAESRVPVIIIDDYCVPKWISSDTLVFALDYYGSTDQVVSVYREAAAKKARMLSISVGGELAREARRVRANHIALRYGALARVAFYYTLGALVAIAKKLGIVDLKESTVSEVTVLARTLLENINPEVAQYQNNAKQLAEKISSRPSFCVASGPLTAIADKWGVSCSSTGKVPITVMPLLQFNATILNGLVGSTKPAESPFVVMLQSKYDHQKNKQIQTLVYQVSQAQKIVYEQIFMHPSGSLLGEMVLSSLLGEMVGYYVALLQHQDPSETKASDFIFDELTTVTE